MFTAPVPLPTQAPPLLTTVPHVISAERALPQAVPAEAHAPGLESGAAREALHQRLVDEARDAAVLSLPRRVDITLTNPRGATVVLHISRTTTGEIRAQLASDSAAVLTWLGNEVEALRRGEANGVRWLPPQAELALPTREPRTRLRGTVRRDAPPPHATVTHVPAFR